MVVQPGLCGGLVGNPEDRISHNEAHIKQLAFEECFLKVLTILYGNVAGLVAWFKLGGVPVPMFVKSAHKSVHGGCVNNAAWKFVPSVDNAVADLLLCSLKE